MASALPTLVDDGGFAAGRIQPVNYTPVDGDFALVIGSDLPDKIRDVAVGDAFGCYQDVDLTNYDRISFAYSFRQTEGSSAASVRGLETTYPVALTGTDTLQLAIDGGSTQEITFAATDSELEEVVDRINATLSVAVASADNGQLKITSNSTGTGSSVEVVGGTVYALLGFSLGTVTGVYVTFRFAFEIDGVEFYSAQPATDEIVTYVRRTINVQHLTGTKTLTWYLEAVVS